MTNEEYMEEENADLDRINRLIHNIEEDLRTLKSLLNLPATAGSSGLSTYFRSPGNDEAEVIEGIFDGERMVDTSGKSYQVSANYASKSKLVEGDPLKLYITQDGKYFYKQVGPIERKTVPGILKSEGNHYVVEAEDGNEYRVLTASVTYYMSLYHLQPGDRVMVMIPADRPARWAVIDNVL
jgi:hypothetical protein